VSDPFKIYSYLYKASFGSWGAFSDVIVKATPLLLIGLGCSLAFRMRLWNIGAEGQFFVGAFMASAVVMVPLVNLETTPTWAIISLMAVLGMVGGALYAFIPGILKAKLNINEIITTLMLNYIAVLWNNYWIFGNWSEAGFQMTKTFPKVAWLPRLADYARQVPAFSGMTLHVGSSLRADRRGHRLSDHLPQQMGVQITSLVITPVAARYAGINIAANTILVFMVSGALAGLAGMTEVSGVVHRLQERISTSYGFSGVIVAWLAKLHPFAVIVVSILFGALLVASREIQPSGISFLIQGITLFLVISSDVLLKYEIKWVHPAQETAQ